MLSDICICGHKLEMHLFDMPHSCSICKCEKFKKSPTNAPSDGKREKVCDSGGGVTADTEPKDKVGGQQTDCDSSLDCGCCSCTKARRKYESVDFGCISYDANEESCVACQSQGTMADWLKLDCFEGDET